MHPCTSSRIITVAYLRYGTVIISRRGDSAGHAALHAVAAESDLHRDYAQGKKLLVLVGQKKALGIAVRNDKTHGGTLDYFQG